MTNTEKKILIYLFLKSTEPGREFYRPALHALAEILNHVSPEGDEHEKKLAITKLLHTGHIGLANLENKYYLTQRGEGEARPLIWSLTKHLPATE
ncbi:MAG: hypothetical protein WC878_05070 [Candidatus Paceibacterota bacterium]|jgi:hypothetical protein